MTEVLLADAETLADLTTFLGRIGRADPDGVARLVGHGSVLAVYVCPVHGGGPIVLGLRTVALAAEATVDLTAELRALSAGLEAAEPTAAGPVRVRLPGPAGWGASWAGASPPRSGWEPVGELTADELTASARAGIEEIHDGVPGTAGAAAVATLRGRVWGRPLVDRWTDLPAGVAYAAQVLGFVDPGRPAAVFRAGPWWRASTPRGHVLARRAPVGLALG